MYTTPISHLNLPPGAALALVLVGLVNSRGSKLDGGADSSGASMLETLKK